jgi:hypothetical protein
VRLIIHKGSESNPDLIPKALNLVFESLETNPAMYHSKPVKFDETAMLSDKELQSELKHKDTIMKVFDKNFWFPFY